jgi:acetyl esterase/lipase
MTIKRLVLLVVAAVTIARAAEAQNIPPDLADVEYAVVNGIRLKLDLYFPRNTPKPYPVIMFVHGGGWSGGSKTNNRADFLARYGYAVVSIDYRLSGQAIFPAQLYDCKAAVRWLRANVAKYDLDPNRIGAFGSSAGGHLVALLGTTMGVDSLEGRVGGNLQFSSAVQAVCDWYGPSNFLTICDYPSAINHCAANSPEAQLIGGAIPTHRAKALAASPITYVGKGEPPFLLMHGTLDLTVPFQQSVELDSALRQAGGKVVFKPIVGGGHGDAAFETDSTELAVVEFFARYLTASPVGVNARPEVAAGFHLEQNYPNPFNPATAIKFTLPRPAPVQLVIFDVTGKEVARLIDNEVLAEGRHVRQWEARAQASGVYFYRLTADDFHETQKMSLIR